jgi:hypothetical protein
MAPAQARQRSKLERELPIFPNTDFDLVFDKIGWPIATNSDVPEEFLRMSLAGTTTCYLGNRSIDYVYKKYFKEKTFDVHDGSRLDYRTKQYLLKRISFFDFANSFVADGKPSHFGQEIAMWTLLRLKFSLRLLLTCAQRGGLFESASIGRSVFEQVAWSFRIRNLDDTDDITSTSSTKSIGELKSVFGQAGQFYGWLSDHAHWAYVAHSKVHFTEKQYHRHLLANSALKAKSLLVIVVLIQLAFEVLQTIALETRNSDDWDGLLRLHEQSRLAPHAIVREIFELADEEHPDDSDFAILKSFIDSIGVS